MHRTARLTGASGGLSVRNRACCVSVRPGAPTAWSLAVLCLCSYYASVLLAEDQISQRIDPPQRTSLCAFCGSETFACGSSMAPIVDANGNESSVGLAQNLTSSSSLVHSLNAKVQQVLVKLNRHRQMLNSSNCTCIPIAWRCDGQADCGDLSDEIGCGESGCSPIQFSCATNSKCIPKKQLCNGENDCGDNSDELDCTPRQCNMETETRCDNGRCISSDWLCDGENDCGNPHELPYSMELNYTLFIVGDLSDERCINACSSDEFQCHSGDCIPIANYCNNEADCADLSDEVDCQSKGLSSPSTSTSSHVSCPTSQFMCNNGLCISKLYQCDEDNDCGDMSDELACDNSSKCEGEACANNGQQHSTTSVVTEQQTCASEQFQCRSGMCIQAGYKCDGDGDCDDNSDEEGCANKNECISGNFRCRDGTCISLWQICDGQPNCPDGSDEDTNSTCVPGVTPCRENGFPCQHLCVATAFDHFCACKEGYRKGSDGRSCIDIDECQSGNLKSELDYHWLTDSPKEHLIASVQACSQLCSNSVPGFQCSCVEGYHLTTDKRRCKAMDGPLPLIIAVDHLHHFSVFTLDSPTDKQAESPPLSESDNTAFSPKLQIAFDYAYTKQLLFWTDPRTQQIFSALMKLNESSNENFASQSFQSTLKLHRVRPIIQSGLVMLSGLSVDWVNNRLYWTDVGTSQIEFSNFDGSGRKVLFHQYIQKPHSIVTHPEKSQIFWADWGEPARIESAFMDGSGRQVIVSSFLGMPSGLTIDYPALKLYWADEKQSVIECSNLDGSGRFIIVHDHVLRPVSLTLFEDTLYWSSANSSVQIRAVSKLTRNNVRTLPSLAHANLEVKVLHPLRQPSVHSSPCHSHPCSHICLPNNVTFRCSCPFEYSLEGGNEHKCKPSQHSLLLFTHRNDIRAVRIAKKNFIPESELLYNDYSLAHVLPIGHISFVVSFDYDPSSSTIFWTDIVNKSIGLAKWVEQQQETIITGSLETPSGIALDWATSNIYFCDTSRNVIEVAKTNGAFRSLVVWRSLEQPRDIVVDPVSGLMFWSQWSNTTSNIERAAMDGSHRIILHALNLTKPQGLALDHLYRRLYWADSGRAVIECSSYDGSDRRTVISKNVQHPFAVAIAGDMMYFSDLQLRNVQQAHKLSGEMQSIVLENVDGLMDIGVLQQNRSVLRHEFAFTNACQQAKCSHLCLLSPMQPGYRCFCPTGILLLADGHTCAHDMSKYLIFTTRKAIRRISLESDHHLDVSITFDRPLENAFVLDVHSHSKTVFWTDTNENIIYRANMLTGKTESIVRFGLLDPNGLAVDSVGEKLFWTDAGRKRIEVSKLDGTQRKALISQDLDSPRAIALNHQTGHMVWADWGAQVRIERADMDGTKRAILVSEHLGWPNGITITKSGKIIWADSKTHTIEIVDMNGANRRKIAEDLASPYGVTLMSNHLYFTDWHSKTIYRVHLPESELNSNAQFGSVKVEIFAKSLPNIVDIRAIDQQEEELAFEEQHNMCQINNGGCSHLCLRNSAPGYSCRCPTGLTLLADARTCKTEISKQLLVACKNSLRIISLESQDLSDTYLPVDGLVDVVSIDFHFSRGLIFYIDRALNEIRSLKMPANTSLSQLGTVTSLLSQTVLSTELVQPNSLAVDWIGDNLYFSDQKRHLIEVARLDGSSRKVLIDLDLDGPKCLLVLPDVGFIFWINSGSQQRIERAFLDGSGRLAIVNADIGKLNGLAVDRATEENGSRARIYWTDGDMSRIESALIDGTERESVLTKGITLPHSVAVLDEFIFWTDAYNKVIERANRWSTDNYLLIADNVDSLREIKTMSLILSLQTQTQTQLSTPRMPANASTMEQANPCARDNGACSHLCLFRPHGYICACPSYPEKRPCSTVPGEIVPSLSPVTVAREVKESDQEKSISLNSNADATEATPRWNNQPALPKGPIHTNESLGGKSVAELCRENATLAKCDSSLFSFADEHILQMTYVLALILLSLAVFVCSILACICKRKLMEEELKSSIKMENNVQAMELCNNTIVPVASVKSLHLNPFGQSTFEQSFYGREAMIPDGYYPDTVPPPPPPPRRLLGANANNIDYEFFKPLDLRLSPLSIDHLGRTHMAQNATSRMGPQAWAQTLPRHLGHLGTGVGAKQQSRSAFNSPYVSSKAAHNKREYQHAPINYLCLESSRLETDI